MQHARISGSFCGVAALLGQCAARPAILRHAADCAKGRAVHRIAWLVATQALQGCPLPCLVFTDASGGSGGAALGACFFLMVPKITRTPWTSRGKSILEPIGAKKEKKQPAPPLKYQTGARGRGAQQSALVLEKTARDAA
ncbi:hypothetical protein NDU88_002500 [Pleurodeles waltl]|uniref:Secreted protein n=1 Tax=Pleurodeles waltl TaxID=8319 RepID=A0AAV7NDX8_PLEWA|nr:hypothetical protein NDU88_002500 [Pleurodeles waltl]